MRIATILPVTRKAAKFPIEIFFEEDQRFACGQSLPAQSEADALSHLAEFTAQELQWAPGTYATVNLCGIEPARWVAERKRQLAKQLH